MDVHSISGTSGASQSSQASPDQIVITITDKVSSEAGRIDEHSNQLKEAVAHNELFGHHRRHRTIAHMKAENPYVAKMPSYMLKDASKEISNEDLKMHSVVQSLLYLGIPSSTIPALYRNPSCWGIGFGIGSAGGALIVLAASSHLKEPGYVGQWLERTAAMKDSIKSSIASVQGLGVSANTLLTMLGPNTEYFAVMQGAIAGSTISYEAISLAAYLFSSYMESRGDVSSSDDENASPQEPEVPPKVVSDTIPPGPLPQPMLPTPEQQVGLQLIVNTASESEKDPKDVKDPNS